MLTSKAQFITSLSGTRAWDPSQNPSFWAGVACSQGGAVESLVLQDFGLYGMHGRLNRQQGFRQQSMLRACPGTCSGCLTAPHLLTGPLDLDTGLESLEVLDLTNSTITRLSPSLPQALPALQKLVLDNCQLDGTLPDGETSALKLPDFLCTREANHLPQAHGAHPRFASAAWGSGWPELQFISFELNPGLGGPLPDSYSMWSDLQSFQASGCQLQGQLPASWPQRMTQLELLNLGHNLLSRELPSYWASSNLQYINLRYNFFTVWV